MMTRTSIRHVTFAHGFKLAGMKHNELPGTYSVETHSEDSGAFSQKGNQKETVWIRICETPGLNGRLRMVKIDPGDLETALKLDAKKGPKVAKAGRRKPARDRAPLSAGANREKRSGCDG